VNRPLCRYWKDCDITGGGCCRIKAFDRPSYGTCANCSRRRTGPGDWLFVALSVTGIHWLFARWMKVPAAQCSACEKRRQRLNGAA